MRVNRQTKRQPIHTHEGAPARHINAEQQLRRSVLSCLLWESEFYEDGQEIAKRIEQFAAMVPPETLAALAVEARTQAHLRHVPLLLLRTLVRTGFGKGKLVADAICNTIERADELAEFVALYWQTNKGKPLTNPMRRGLARAFNKFDAYQLGKYNRPGDVRLRDVMFLCRPTPQDEAQAAAWKLLADNTLPAPDTWESQLTGGADKRETFTRLLNTGKLGYLALLRNLRGMDAAGVEPRLIRDAIVARKGADRVLPFRFIAAARAAPQFEPELDAALCENIATLPRLEGETLILVDVSGSMYQPLSLKSDLTRMDAAAALASVVNGHLGVFTFSDSLVRVPARRGMAGVQAIIDSQNHNGTQLGAAIERVNKTVRHGRLIVVTDEQAELKVPAPVAERAYMINVASARNGVGYGKPWVHLDGFSENVIKWIVEHERFTDDASRC